eukprot:gene14414-16554_t
MISIDVYDIPSFLRSGSFYEFLDTSEPHAQIQVPESCYVENDEVNNIADLAKLSNVVAFWTLHSIPLSMVVFCEQTEASIWRDVLSQHDELDFEKALLSIFQSTTPLEKAIELGTTEYAYEQGLEWNMYTAEMVAEAGHLDVLKFLIEHNCPVDGMALALAAEKGRVDCLKYLLDEVHLPVNYAVTEVAAMNGHLGCLQLLHQRTGTTWRETQPRSNILQYYMISIDVDNVPNFLRSGSFYESLDTSEQRDEIQVPESCYVENDEVNNIADLAKLIKVVAFWTLYSIPLPMIVFCDQTEPSVWREVLSKHEELDFATALIVIFESTTPLEKAIELGAPRR